MTRAHGSLTAAVASLEDTEALGADLERDLHAASSPDTGPIIVLPTVALDRHSGLVLAVIGHRRAVPERELDTAVATISQHDTLGIAQVAWDDGHNQDMPAAFPALVREQVRETCPAFQVYGVTSDGCGQGARLRDAVSDAAILFDAAVHGLRDGAHDVALLVDTGDTPKADLEAAERLVRADHPCARTGFHLKVATATPGTWYTKVGSAFTEEAREHTIHDPVGTLSFHPTGERHYGAHLVHYSDLARS